MLASCNTIMIKLGSPFSCCRERELMSANLFSTGDRNAGPRWQEFWDEASRKELGDKKKVNTADHPLQGLMVKDGKTISILGSIIIAKWSFVNISKNS